MQRGATRKQHWEHVYRSTDPSQVGWYRPHLETSFQWITELGLARDARIIDVGTGASSLPEDLLREGYRNLTLMDLSEAALRTLESRLGTPAEDVIFVHGDVASTVFPPAYHDLWHDRAVFHFLVSPQQQERYRANLLETLKPGGYALIATFTPEAPPKCSGLPVQRYTAEGLRMHFEPELALVKQQTELHVTPTGVEQPYVYALFRKPPQ